MNLKAFVKKYEIWIFLVLGPLSNIIFVQARIHDLMSRSMYNTGRFCLLLFILICIIKYTRGNEGIRDLFKPMLKWKVHPKWFFLCLIFPTTIATITLLLKALYYDVEYSTFFTLITTTVRGYIANFVWAFLGEVVWVSYCIRQLSKIVKPLYASQIIAVFWTLWFIPILILGEGTFPEIPILPAFLFFMGLSGMCAFVYKHTKSGLCVLLLQTMVNYTAVSLPIMPTTGGAPTYITFAVIYFLVMLGLWGLEFLITTSKKKELIQSGWFPKN
ncbi:type II CAAX prenyl endopeptidase Rce1 family protein [Winogradskyella sp. SM1960]|uniref:type II CAAX prenyl endopeptidase Rce1 family protein n=1 Tax=Winogradskyella sp. SM1960 TaxID=2865955 RepID=UPI001CD266CD|nr:CPBP family glutamic-type intramembrane protease [Winogradskyella sp. SM1960]